MSLKTNIVGAGNNQYAHVEDGFREGRHKPRGLVTYGLNYEFEVNAPRYAVNDTYGNRMNVNGTSSGATDGIHDGIDSVLWTASALSGTWVFNSTTQAFAGTNSIDATGTVDTDQALFTRASSIDPATYNTVEGAIYIDSWSSSGTKDVTLQFRLAGAPVGNLINLSGYINTTSTGSWQVFSIPTAAFGFSGSVDELVVTTVDIGAGPPPNYYLDALKFQATSAGTGPQTFTIEPDYDELLRCYGISWTIVDNYAPATAVGGALGLSYDKFGGLSALTNGVLTRRIQGQEVLFTNITKGNSDIITAAGGELVEFWHDGTNTYTKFYVRFGAPVDLNGRERDKFEFIVRDNLSSLITFNVRVDGVLVTKNNGGVIL